MRLYNDGVLVFNQLRTTLAPSGSFTVRKLTANGAGDDVIVGRARNLTTDEICRARIVL